MATSVKTMQPEGKGSFFPTWEASCGIVDLTACETAEEPLRIAPSDLRGRTPLAVLREAGWVKTKQYGWLCGPCHRAYRTGTLTPSDDYDD